MFSPTLFASLILSTHYQWNVSIFTLIWSAIDFNFMCALTYKEQEVNEK